MEKTLINGAESQSLSTCNWEDLSAFHVGVH
jgi:hypothetical protein